MTIPTLQQAQNLILAHIKPGAGEIVPLDQAMGRIAATAIRARLAVPSFPQSCRDGYALRAEDTQAAGIRPGTSNSGPGRPQNPAAAVRLQVRGEIAAGRTRPAAGLRAGQAYRIMTGGMLPPGADSVIAFEEVSREAADHIMLTVPCRPGAHIRPVGTDLRQNQIIVPPGRPVCPEHLPLLATAGVGELAVYRRPRVGLLCTGNELLDDIEGNPPPGSLISGNRFLLAGLIRRYGGEPVDLGTVRDDVDAIADILAAEAPGGFNALISTGGMGPGKYDLVSRALAKLEAKLLYEELRLRPGKATMAAVLGKTLFFGLPGPPPAVHLLFYLLVAPALGRAQGYRHPRPVTVQARLTDPLPLRRGDFLQLKGGRLDAEAGTLLVRLTRPDEAINAIILVPPNRRHLKKDELVRVQPLAAGLPGLGL